MINILQRKTLFHLLYSQSHSFGHYLDLAVIGEARNDQ